MKKDSRDDGPPVLTPSRDSRDDDDEQFDYNVPMDLTKRSPKEDEEDHRTDLVHDRASTAKEEDKSVDASAWMESWQRILSRALPPSFVNPYLLYGNDVISKSLMMSENGMVFPFQNHHPLLFPHGYPPVVTDPNGNRFALLRTPDGSHMVPVPLDQFHSAGNNVHSSPPTLSPQVSPHEVQDHENKENEGCECKCCQRRKQDDASSLDLRRSSPDGECPRHGPRGDEYKSAFTRTSSASRPYSTDKHSNPTLIRFLESRVPSPRTLKNSEDDLPEDLSPAKTRSSLSDSSPRTDVSSVNDDEGCVKRSSSCSKLFEITSESLVERLMRARCKSDSEILRQKLSSSQDSPSPEKIQNDNLTASRENTLKRRILGGIGESQTTDHESKKEKLEIPKCPITRIHNPKVIERPHSRQQRTTEGQPHENLIAALASGTKQIAHGDHETFLQQLRHLSPEAGFPWNVYTYYTHLMQRLQDQEVLKRHFQERVSDMMQETSGSPSPRPPSPNYMSPGLDDGDDSGLNGDGTFNGMRKRAPRALTGKHVRHGTGASPSTLMTLRQMIQERQRAKELGIVTSSGKGSKSKANKGLGKVPLKKDKLVKK